MASSNGNIRINASVGTAEWNRGIASMEASLGRFKTSGGKNIAEVENAINKLQAMTPKATANINGMTTAMTKNTAATNSAAGANANLVSQFNDIAVMMAAGQSPLQLAMQQGTQISQVLTGMGGGVGALKALAGAFIGMLNPISLATIGVIGFGAAAFQWLMPAEEEAKKVKDAFEALKDSANSYKEAMGVNLLYTGEAEKQYGEQAQRGSEIARRIMEMEAKKTRDSVSRILAEAYSAADMENLKDGNQSAPYANIGGAMGFDTGSYFTAGGIKPEDAAVAKQYADQILRIQQLVTTTDMTKFDMEAFAADLDQELATAQAILDKAIEQGAAEATIAQHRQRLTELQNVLLVQAQEIAVVKAAEEAKAEEMLSTIEQEISMRGLILQYGEDSIQVRYAELEAEHAKTLAAIETLNVTAEIKEELYAAADANYDAESATIAWANALAGVKAQIAGIVAILSQIGGGMIASAQKFTTAKLINEGASRVEAEKQVKYAEQDRELAAQQANNKAIYGDTVGGALNWGLETVHKGNRNADEALMAAFDLDAEREKAARAASRGGGGGRGRKGRGGGAGSRGGKTEAEKDAERYTKSAENLDKKLKELQATVRMTAEEEEIWKAQRDQGVLGNAAGMAAVEKTMKEIQALEDQKEALRKNGEFAKEMGNAFGEAFSSIISGTEKASDALKNLIKVIANRALTNLFTNLFAGNGFSLKNLLGAHANGGIVNTAMQLVGERGPELVSMPQGSRVHTAQQTAKMLGGSGAIVVNLRAYTDGMVKTEILNEANSSAASIADSKLKQYDKGSNNRIRAFQQNPNKA